MSLLERLNNTSIETLREVFYADIKYMIEETANLHNMSSWKTYDKYMEDPRLFFLALIQDMNNVNKNTIFEYTNEIKQLIFNFRLYTTEPFFVNMSALVNDAFKNMIIKSSITLNVKIYTN